MERHFDHDVDAGGLGAKRRERFALAEKPVTGACPRLGL
jgi:hypothetical protein